MDGTGQISNAVDQVDAEELSQILDDLAGGQKAISEATNALRAKLKQVLDDKGWNKVALGMIRSIDAKSETARADLLRTFVPMFEVMMDAKWRDEMHDLVDDAGNGAGPDGD